MHKSIQRHSQHGCFGRIGQDFAAPGVQAIRIIDSAQHFRIQTADKTRYSIIFIPWLIRLITALVNAIVCAQLCEFLGSGKPADYSLPGHTTLKLLYPGVLAGRVGSTAHDAFITAFHKVRVGKVAVAHFSAVKEPVCHFGSGPVSFFQLVNPGLQAARVRFTEQADSVHPIYERRDRIPGCHKYFTGSGKSAVAGGYRDHSGTVLLGGHIAGSGD